MSYLDALGIQEWSPEEIGEKETAVKRGAERRLVNVISSAVPDEFEIVDIDGASQEAELAWSLDAVNHLLALLNFPNKLKPFLDSILGACGACGSNEFVATNWEIGQRSRSGRAACSDASMEKWVSRQKTRLDEWMAYKSFQLVKVTPGEYNWETKKAAPTRYRVFFNEYVVKTVNLAKTKFYWRSGGEYRRFQGRAIREAARSVLMEIPEAPNLKLKPAKTLSEEEKFNRRHKQILTFLKKNRDAIASAGYNPIEYFNYAIEQTNQVAINPPGTIGNILTPEADEPVRDVNVWRKFVTGEIQNDTEIISQKVDTKIDLLENIGFDAVEYAVLSVQSETEPRNVDKPRYWKGDHFVESDQAFDSAPKTESVKHSASDNFDTSVNAENQPDIFSENAKLLKINDQTNRTFLSGRSENSAETNGTNRETSRTFLSGRSSESEQVLNTPKDDLLDFLDWSDSGYSFDDVNKIVSDWNRLVHEKIPPLTPAELWAGKYQIYWGDLFARDALEAEEKLTNAISEIADGERDISELKSIYSAWIMERTSFYKSGAVIAQSAPEKANFRKRLEAFIKLPGEVGDG